MAPRCPPGHSSLDHQALDAGLWVGKLRVEPLERVDEQGRDGRALDPVPVSRDDMPRRPFGRRRVENLVPCGDVLVVTLPDVEIGSPELPALLRVVDSLLE